MVQSNSFLLQRTPKSRWIESGLIVGFWMFLFLLSVAQDAFDFKGPEGVTPGELQRSGIEHFLWLLLTPCILWLTDKYHFERGTYFKDLTFHILFALAVSIAMQAYSHFSFIYFIWGSERASPTFIESLTAFLFIDELMLYLFVVAAGFARNYFFRYRKHLEETARLRAEAALLQTQLAEARLQALRMQLNPHFLFNTLNAVSVLVSRDPEGVRKMIALLSDLLRYALEKEDAPEVPLHQELRFLRSYFQIQEIRFQGKFEVEENIDDDVIHALVPCLILQPLAENAVEHGARKVVGEAKIHLRAWREKDMLFLTIRDNGPGLVSNNERKGVGLRNTRDRLSELYGAKAHLALEQGEEGGVLATLSLPFHI